MAQAQRIVVDHVARLDDGTIAVAGVDQAHVFIAPEREQSEAADGAGPWDTESTVRGGGPFGIGELVDLGFSRPSGEPPRVENRVVEVSNVQRLGRLSDGDFWSLLETLGEDSLPAIFGPSLVRLDSGAAVVPLKRGMASLGILRCPGPAELFRRGHQLRMGLDDLRLGSLDLAVCDFRLRGEDGTPIDSMWKVIRRRVAAGEPVLLSVGLSRPFNGSHWLRIDNIHFRDYFDDHPVFRFAR